MKIRDVPTSELVRLINATKLELGADHVIVRLLNRELERRDEVYRLASAAEQGGSNE